MLKVNFHELGTIKDKDLIFAVIIVRYNNKLIFVKHKQRNTWEIPGGHREDGETIENCAKRELVEETGAKDFNLIPLFIYSVEKDNVLLDYGQVFLAETKTLGQLPESEIEKIEFFDELPDNLTYPLIQPFILKNAMQIIK